jgi:hypothetical protein
MSPSWVLGSTSFVLTAPVAGGYTIVLDPYTSLYGQRHRIDPVAHGLSPLRPIEE